MKFELKDYKLKKAIDYYKKTPIFFIFNVANTNSKNWIKVEQDFYDQQLKHYKIYNTLLIRLTEKSIFQKMNLIINSSTCFIYFKNDTSELNLHKLIKLNPLISCIGLKLNHKLYSVSQLSKVSTLNHTQNIKIFNKLLKKIIKFPYYKLNK